MRKVELQGLLVAKGSGHPVPKSSDPDPADPKRPDPTGSATLEKR